VNVRRATGFAFAATVHGALLAGAWVHAAWKVDELAPPTPRVSITLGATLGRPPPARGTNTTNARAARAPARRPRPRMDRPAALLPASTVMPVLDAADPTASASEGSEDSAPTGVAAGVIAGLGADEPAPALPPPLPPSLAAFPPVRPARIDEARRQALLAAYAPLVRARIAAAFRYPSEAQRLELEGSVLVVVRLDRSGRLLDARPTGACPHPVLCQAALATVRGAAPFPALPPELGAEIDITVPIAYRLE